MINFIQGFFELEKKFSKNVVWKYDLLRCVDSKSVENIYQGRQKILFDYVVTSEWNNMIYTKFNKERMIT